LGLLNRETSLLFLVFTSSPGFSVVAITITKHDAFNCSLCFKGNEACIHESVLKFWKNFQLQFLHRLHTAASAYTTASVIHAITDCTLRPSVNSLLPVSWQFTTIVSRLKTHYSQEKVPNSTFVCP
jgi:hypothetical protein